MPAGFPVKANYAVGDVLTAANMNDLSETLNYLDPTAKGDLFPASSSTALTRLAVGANDTVLTADSSTATGLKWATAASGGMTLISTTTISNNATVTIGSIPSTYNSLVIYCRNILPATDGVEIRCRITGDANTRYAYSTSTEVTGSFGATFWKIADAVDNATSQGSIQLELPSYANTTTWKQIYGNAFTNNSTTSTNYLSLNAWGGYNQTSAISSLDFFASSGNLTSGTILVYGVK